MQYFLFMNSIILFVNLFIIFILTLIVATTLITKRESIKARLSFSFFFLNIILVCVSNLITFFGSYKLVFVPFLISGFVFLFGPMLLQYVYFNLEIKLPKYWSLNYWVLLLLCLSGVYYLFLPDELKKKYFAEILQGTHLPLIIITNLSLLHSVIYFIYLRVFINRFTVNTKENHLQIKKEWVSQFVNYMILCNVILIIYFIIVSVFYVEYIVIGDLVVMPIIVFTIYCFIVIKHSQMHKEAELKYVLVQIENQNKLLEQRLEISRDLHDNIGSKLTFIVITINTIKYYITDEDEKLTDKLNTIKDFAKVTTQELRDTVWAMNKSDISIKDLHSRIANFIEKAKQSQNKTNITVNVDENLPEDVTFTSLQGLNAFRIIQEATNNALKYAKASQITIHIYKKEDNICFSVKDNGKGFIEKNVELGNGLLNMRKRSIELKSQLNIQTELEKGVEVSFCFVIPKTTIHKV